jgi:hypothetical protein
MGKKLHNVASPHLKQGNDYPDSIATAKATGQHFSDTAKLHETPESTPHTRADRHSGGKNTPDRN